MVGAGQAGLQLAFGLLERGCAVTVLTDRSPEEVFHGRATATAFMFDRALSYERELRLNLWDDVVPWGDGIHLDFCRRPGRKALVLEGRLRAPGQAVDQRLKYARWMEELERRGGTLVVRGLAAAELDGLAARHDLVCVAAGKGEIAAAFERDPRRSPHDAPRRRLALLTLHGVPPWEEIPLRNPVKFSFCAGVGELFWIPFLDRSGTPCRSLLFEAVPGGRLDRFGGATTGEELVELARGAVAEFFPWERGRLADVELTDPLAWAKGAITPTVRRPVAVLPSGRAVLGVGDTVVLNDPIAGQGSNCASKLARFLAERIAAHEGPFDAPWMERAFEDFWAADARAITAFSNLLLEPLRGAAKEVLLAGSCSRAVCDELFDAFDEPGRATWLYDLGEARRLVRELTGRPWLRTAAVARARALAARVPGG